MGVVNKIALSTASGKYFLKMFCFSNIATQNSTIFDFWVVALSWPHKTLRAVDAMLSFPAMHGYEEVQCTTIHYTYYLYNLQCTTIHYTYDLYNVQLYSKHTICTMYNYTLYILSVITAQVIYLHYKHVSAQFLPIFDEKNNSFVSLPRPANLCLCFCRA